MTLNLPLKLKSLNSYLKTANELEKRDPVVSYYCRLFAVQKGMELDRSSPDGKKFLMELMDTLDKTKKELKDNESIISETVGQAHVEQYALKLFSYADKKDRDADFGMATIRSFVTAGFLMDVLGVFGEVPEDVEKCRKYAKWKAVYINQCLKNGEAPHPGPLEDGDEIANANDLFPSVPAPSSQPASSNGAPFNPVPAPRTTAPAVAPPVVTHVAPAPTPAAAATSPGCSHSPEEFAQAEKLCKFAISSLQYQDSDTAVKYLSQCLQLLSKK